MESKSIKSASEKVEKHLRLSAAGIIMKYNYAGASPAQRTHPVRPGEPG